MKAALVALVLFGCSSQPPMEAHPNCNPACVARVCESRCQNHLTIAQKSCRQRCAYHMTRGQCSVCKDID